MLINSSNTGKGRKETRYFHWLEKWLQAKLQKNKTKQEEKNLSYHLEYTFRNVLLKST